MPKRKTATKKSTTTDAAPAPAPVADPAPVATTDDNNEEEEEELSCSKSMSMLIADLEKLTKITRGLTNSMKKCKRAHENELKAAKKAAKGSKTKRKKDPNAPKRPPSGFNKPGPLSKELCKFLGVDSKQEMTRPEVTKMINAYIKEHNLQNEANKREIIPDKKLSKLLNGPPDGEALTYFNLQKCIKHHFPKPSATASKK